MQPPEQVLRERFGHDSFKPGQLEVINHLLERTSAAAVFPTGGGKSPCYQLPSLYGMSPVLIWRSWAELPM